jgi:hypothetical protein
MMKADFEKYVKNRGIAESMKSIPLINPIVNQFAEEYAKQDFILFQAWYRNQINGYSKFPPDDRPKWAFIEYLDLAYEEYQKYKDERIF